MGSCEEIGTRIKELRERKGLTQADLAAKMNTSRESINQWERGARDMKTGTIIALASLLNTSCDYLLVGIESEHIDIHHDIGLSDEAVKILREAHALSSPNNLDPNMVNVINALLSQKLKIYDILQQIYAFFYTDFSRACITFGHLTADGNARIPFPLMKHDLGFIVHDKEATQEPRTMAFAFDEDVYMQAFLEKIKVQMLRRKMQLDGKEGEE